VQIVHIVSPHVACELILINKNKKSKICFLLLCTRRIPTLVVSFDEITHLILQNHFTLHLIAIIYKLPLTPFPYLFVLFSRQITCITSTLSLPPYGKTMKLFTLKCTSRYTCSSQRKNQSTLFDVTHHHTQDRTKHPKPFQKLPDHCRGSGCSIHVTSGISYHDNYSFYHRSLFPENVRVDFWVEVFMFKSSAF
jgi:hypothetical protein